MSENDTRSPDVDRAYTAVAKPGTARTAGSLAIVAPPDADVLDVRSEENQGSFVLRSFSTSSRSPAADRKNTRVTPDGSTTTVGSPAASGAVPRTVTSLAVQPFAFAPEVNTSRCSAVVRAATTTTPWAPCATETLPVTEAADSSVVRSVETQSLTGLVEGVRSRRSPFTLASGEMNEGRVSGSAEALGPVAARPPPVAGTVAAWAGAPQSRAPARRAPTAATRRRAEDHLHELCAR